MQFKMLYIQSNQKGQLLAQNVKAHGTFTGFLSNGYAELQKA